MNAPENVHATVNYGNAIIVIILHFQVILVLVWQRKWCIHTSFQWSWKHHNGAAQGEQRRGGGQGKGQKRRGGEETTKAALTATLSWDLPFCRGSCWSPLIGDSSLVGTESENANLNVVDNHCIVAFYTVRMKKEPKMKAHHEGMQSKITEWILQSCSVYMGCWLLL